MKGTGGNKAEQLVRTGNATDMKKVFKTLTFFFIILEVLGAIVWDN